MTKQHFGRMRTPAGLNLRVVLAAVLLLLLTTGDGCAQTAAGRPGPGFDCEKATTGLEQIICTDPVLGPLDGALTEAWKTRRAMPGDTATQEALLADQRAWLRARIGTCAVPAVADAEPNQRFKAIPCLITLYRQRIAALGGRLPAPLPVPAGNRTGVLHPMCLEALWHVGGGMEQDDDPGDRPPPVVDLATCRAGTAHIPITDRSVPGQPTTEDEFFDAERTDYSFQGPAGFFGYHLVGRTASGISIYSVEDSGGGTGLFSALLTVREDGRTLNLVQVLPAGDRCTGGLESARLGADGKVRTKSYLTPADVGLLMAEAAGHSAEEPPYDTLASCSACCFGLRVDDVDPASGDTRLLGVTFDERPEVPDDDPSGACLVRAVTRTAATASFPIHFDEARLVTLDRTFRASCRR